MSARISVPQKELAEYCRKWSITELALFGSVLRDDFGPDSDIDVLVKFTPDAGHTLFDLIHMENELRGIFGRDVDLVTYKAIENGRNYLRKKLILESAEVVYAA